MRLVMLANDVRNTPVLPLVTMEDLSDTGWIIAVFSQGDGFRAILLKKKAGNELVVLF